MAFQVLERRETKIGGRKVISIRVADPKLPKIKRKQRPARVTTNNSIPPQLLLAAAKEHHTVALSATVHEGEETVTHLRWSIYGKSTATRKKFEAWSRVDWNYMRGIPTLSTDTDKYMILMCIGPPSFSEEIPALPTATEGQAEYFVFADSLEDIDEKAFEVIDLLHAHYEANEPELKIHWQRRQAINDATKRHAEANPKKPQDSKVYFWKPETK